MSHSPPWEALRKISSLSILNQVAESNPSTFSPDSTSCSGLMLQIGHTIIWTSAACTVIVVTGKNNFHGDLAGEHLDEKVNITRLRS